MDLGMEDMTGQPRSDKDLTEAIEVIGKVALKPMALPPELTIHLMDIRALLLELQVMRKMLKEARERRETREAGGGC